MFIHAESNTVFYSFDELRLWLVQNKDTALSETQPNFNEVLSGFSIEPYTPEPPAPYVPTYQDKRRMEYAPLQEQLDMQYRDAINGTTEWIDHITDVKTRIPKEDL